MKIYKNIFKDTVALENLLEAWDEFKIDKRKKVDVQIFERNLADNLFALNDDLSQKQYNHGPYFSFIIKDPKVRLIHKATVRDRIVHHAVFRALNPLFEPTFIYDSFSCREQKGTHRAVKRLREFANTVYRRYGRCYVLKCDIKKFFHSIDHTILLRIIAKRIKDSDMLWLIERLINSFSAVTPERERERERESKGCPIGNLTSQLFANVYMNEFDQFMKHDLGIQYYIRYTDDFVVVHHDPEHLWRVKDQINDFLRMHLQLTLHPTKVSVRKYSEGIDFLGYIVLPRGQMLRTKTKRRIMRKLEIRIAEYRTEKISEKQLLQTINSYLAVLSHADSYKLRQKILHSIWSHLKSAD